MVGLNHACWSVVHEYKGTDVMPLVAEAWERRKDDPELTGALRRQLRIAAEMDAIPADYFQYYYCQDEVLAELQAKPTTRAEDILGWSTGYWEHYAEQAESDDPQLDPKFSRGGIHELELAIDAMDAVFNEKDEVLTVNVPNAGGALPGFDDTLVVELLGRCGGPDGWIQPLPVPAPLPAHVRGLVHELGEYQALAAEAAWSGTRLDAIHALAAHPLMVDLDRTERVYDAARGRRTASISPRVCCRRSAECSTSGSTAATRRRSRSSAGRTAAIAGHARTGCSDVYSAAGDFVDRRDRARSAGRDRSGRRRGARVRLLLARGSRLARGHRLLRAGAVAPPPGSPHGGRERCDRRHPLRRRPTASAARSSSAPAPPSARERATAVSGTSAGMRRPRSRSTSRARCSTPRYAASSACCRRAPCRRAWRRPSARPTPSARSNASPAGPPARRGSPSAVSCSTAPSEGDELALDRLRWVASENAAYLRVAARRSGLGEPTPITLAGGVMRHPSSLLVDALAEALPGSELLRARREPAHGALMAALDEGGAAGVELDDSLLPADLFATVAV